MMSNKNLKLPIEFEIDGIVRKLSQLILSQVKTCEMNLFDLTEKLFLSHYRINDYCHAVKRKNQELASKLSKFKSERSFLDGTIEKRDCKIKIIMVGLLKGKKSCNWKILLEHIKLISAHQNI